MKVYAKSVHLQHYVHWRRFFSKYLKHKIYKATYVSKIVVVDLYAGVRKYLGEVIGWTHEEVVAYHVSYHLLVQVSIGYFFPIRVLKINKKIA